MSVLKPLPEELLLSVYDIARRWKPFKTQEKVYGFLEDRITENLTALGHDVAYDRITLMSLSELVSLQTFYTVALFRYMQTTSGLLNDVQHLSLYDTPEGNQVDRYLEEFFKDAMS